MSNFWVWWSFWIFSLENMLIETMENAELQSYTKFKVRLHLYTSFRRYLHPTISAKWPP